MRAVTAVALLVSLAFAGCAGNDSGSTSSNAADTPRSLKELEMQADGYEVESSPDKGIIRGVVVDEAIRPVPQADITLRFLGGDGSDPIEAKTDGNGLFGFGNLEPGAYSILAKRLGYLDAQSSADVQAGVKSPPIVKIILQADPAGLPTFEVFKYDGFIECGFVAVALRLAVCSTPSIATDILCAEAEVCPGNLTNDQFIARHVIDPNNLAFVQSEMAWDSTQALGTRMNVVPGHWDPESDEWGDIEGSAVDGESPITMRFGKGQAGAIEEVGGFQVRVFSSYPEDTGVGGLWGIGLTLQQEFTIITHAFHGFEPDEAWTFLADGSPRVPT